MERSDIDNISFRSQSFYITGGNLSRYRSLPVFIFIFALTCQVLRPRSNGAGPGGQFFQVFCPRSNSNNHYSIGIFHCRAAGQGSGC